jgi:nucleotide-binding universal stress UspA family protein
MWKHILVPHDFSDCAARALEVATELARHGPAQLTLLHVSPIPPNLSPNTRVTAPGKTQARSVSELLLGGGHRELARLQAALVAKGFAVDVLATTTESEPSAEILRVSKEIAVDVIVLGTHGGGGARRRFQTWLSHLLLGSVAETVIRRARVPVVTVRSHGDERALTREEALAEDELVG